MISAKITVSLRPFSWIKNLKISYNGNLQKLLDHKCLPSKEMRRLFILLKIVILVFATAGISAANDPGLDTDPVQFIRDSVLSCFHPVRGIVSEVEDGIVKVALETEEEMKKGTRLSVFREGRPFYHPTTGELIGKVEEPVGRIEITDRAQGNELYLCGVLDGDIRKGDIVRITSSPIRLAFFQERKADWAISERFYESLKESRRFEIMESYTESYEPERLSEVARKLGAEAILLFSTPHRDGKEFIEVKLIWAEDARIFAQIESDVDEGVAVRPSPEEEIIFGESIMAEPWIKYELGGEELITTGDVDGDGTSELISSNRVDIRIYSLKGELQEIWFSKGSSQERHLSVDALDLNNNGRVEIFVTSLIGGGRIGSFVIEYSPSEGYRRIWDRAPYFFRVIGKRLFMQKFTPYNIFSGPIYEGVWQDGHYQPLRQIRLPEDVNIYGFAFIDWRNNGDLQIISLDDEGFLYLYSNKQLIWKSKEKYGRSETSFRAEEILSGEKEWFVRNRLIPIKTTQGQEIVVVKKIPVVPNFPGLGYKGAEVYSLWWDGETMQERLILRDISGPVSDYWIEGDNLYLITRGSLFSLFKKVASGDFKKGSILYYYNLGRR